MLSMRKISEAYEGLGSMSDRVQPISWQAFALAVLGVLCAALLREAFGLLGATLNFATFYPAIFIIALVAGPLAATLGLVLSILVVYWRSRYGFASLNATTAVNLVLFAFSAGLVVWLADAYRRAIRTMMRQNRERDLLLRELDHRGRNMLTIIESIVRSTASPHYLLADAIMGRIRALSIANELVIHSGLKPIGLTAVLENGLKPYDRTKWAVTGEDIELPPEAARVTALMVHELATNAAKYGAFKGNGGKLQVTWTKHGDEVDLRWEEATAHPVAPPTEYGFGTRLVMRSLGRLGGSIESDFRSEGLRCRIKFALDRAV